MSGGPLMPINVEVNVMFSRTSTVKSAARPGGTLGVFLVY